MKFKGTIIITDPCYIIKELDIKHPNPKDFNLPDSIHSKLFEDYSTSEEIAYKKACDEYWEYQNKHDDWYKCDYGDNMSVLGLENYICESTIYGDWSCTTLEVNNPREVVNELAELLKGENYDAASKKLHQFNYLGQFCADAGEVAVFLLDEVLKYNPDFANWSKEHDWCVTTIKDFNGDIEYYVDDNTEAHIIGTGNINFATFQTGL